MSTRSWFHANLSGVGAKNLLMKYGNDGSFLARPSRSSPGDFTLSVRRNNEVTHIRIQNTGDFYDLYGGEKFASLLELVHYYTNCQGVLKEKNGDIIELKHPLYTEDIISERWFHGNITGKEAEKLVLEKGKNGSFLVRGSTSRPGDFVLSVRGAENNVTHVMVYFKDNQFDVGGGEKFSTLSELVEHYRMNPMVEKSGQVVHLKQPLNTTRISASAISTRFCDLDKTNTMKAGFTEEFERLNMEESRVFQSREEGQRPENRCKNRYKNILPTDQWRVKLTDGDPNIPGSDYINASFIYSDYGGGDMRKAYIATQGCLRNTIGDFWRMVWCHNCMIIVLMTKLSEKTKSGQLPSALSTNPNAQGKCVKYWPEECDGDLEIPVYGGMLKVAYVSTTEHGDYTLRKFELTKKILKKTVNNNDDSENNGQQTTTTEVESPEFETLPSRTIYHYHYTSWPEVFVPKDPEPILSFLDVINDKQESLEDVGPIVVQCSAGIGRTGTVIIIDLLRNQIRLQGISCDIDIPQAIQKARSYRSGLVQSETQYKFIYQAITLYVEILNYMHQGQKNQRLGHEYHNIKYSMDSCLSVSRLSINSPNGPSSSLSSSRSSIFSSVSSTANMYNNNSSNINNINYSTNNNNNANSVNGNLNNSSISCSSSSCGSFVVGGGSGSNSSSRSQSICSNGGQATEKLLLQQQQQLLSQLNARSSISSTSTIGDMEQNYQNIN